MELPKLKLKIVLRRAVAFLKFVFVFFTILLVVHGINIKFYVVDVMYPVIFGQSNRNLNLAWG